LGVYNRFHALMKLFAPTTAGFVDRQQQRRHIASAGIASAPVDSSVIGGQPPDDQDFRRSMRADSIAIAPVSGRTMS
jgi:hypothetical protein